MRRVIWIEAIGRYVTLKTYVNAVRVAKANPTKEFKHGLDSWWPTTGAEIVEQFRAGMTNRINQKIPAALRGMK